MAEFTETDRNEEKSRWVSTPKPSGSIAKEKLEMVSHGSSVINDIRTISEKLRTLHWNK